MNKLDQALSMAMQYCSRRECCVSEIIEKLSKWDVPEEIFDDVISSLIAERFIDEQRYAEAFVSEKFRINGWGKIKISYELRRKKIKEEIIDKALCVIKPSEYSKTIESILLKKLKVEKEQEKLKVKNKLYRYLISRGFEIESFAEMVDVLIKKHFK